MKSYFEFGLEQENLVLNPDGSIFTRDIILADYYTKDFANNQVELVTPVFRDKKNFVRLYNNALNQMKKHYFLWPISVLDEFDPSLVTPAVLEDEEKMKYRQHLLEKYDLNKLLMSGIHYNLSFTEDFLDGLAKRMNVKNNQEFKNKLYFKVLKNFYFYGPLMTYFTSFSPEDKDVISRRNSSYGYNNEAQIGLDISSLTAFNQSIEKAIKDKLIFDKREVYSKIRMKCTNKACVGHNGVCGNVNYLEFRAIDLNPLSPHGFDPKLVDFINYFFLFLALAEEKEIDIVSANKNFDEVALKGYKAEVTLEGFKYNYVSLSELVFSSMAIVFERYDIEGYRKVINDNKKKILEKKNDFVVIRNKTKRIGLFQYGLERMKRF